MTGSDYRPGATGTRMRTDRGGTRIVAIGGGKGGVGRTVLVASIGTYLAQLGKRVVLVDACFGSANLHTVLGLGVPTKTLADVLLRKRESLESIVVETPVPGLALLSGAGDITGIGATRSAERNRFAQMLGELDVDYVLMDLKTGATASDVLDLFLIADAGVVVLAPEPTAIENTYRFIKAAFLRRIWNLEQYKALRGLLADAHGSVKEFGFMSPPTFLAEVSRRFPDLAAPLVDELREFTPQIIVNKCRTRKDHELGENIVSACRRKLRVQMGCLGHIEHDDSVWLSVCKRRPVVLEFPEARPARDVEHVARALLALETGLRPRRPAVPRRPTPMPEPEPAPPGPDEVADRSPEPPPAEEAE